MKTLLLLAVLCAPARAARVDDSDIGGGKPLETQSRWLGAEARREPRAMVFPLGRLSDARTKVSEGAVTGSVELLDGKNAWRPGRLARVRLSGPGAPEGWVPVDDAGRFSLPLSAGLSGTFTVRVSLDNQYWAFHNPNSDASYEWESPQFSIAAGAGADLGKLFPAAGSDNAKLGVLHLTYVDALDFLKREGDVEWWTRTLTVNWPGSADFFSPWSWSLDLTDATHWDVVLHELGHAVQAGSMQARSAGGSHKIDECYSPELAWSEGWGTFFAAAVRLDRRDADAKFEFLVPRRAPIRIENVPDDVCKGEASEWRVAAGLWDLIDQHEDGLDRFSMSFNELWRALRGKEMGSATQAWALVAKTMDPARRRAGEDALIQNTLLPARQPLTAALPLRPVDFDGAAR
jgi:hypothetical protein